MGSGEQESGRVVFVCVKEGCVCVGGGGVGGCWG